MTEDTERVIKQLNMQRSVNADIMSVEQIRQKLTRGYNDMENGNTMDAASSFEVFMENIEKCQTN